MRAYVTSGGPASDAREAPCVRATASRHVVWRARWLAAHERREGLAQHAPPIGGDLGVGARMKAGDACGSLQAPRLLRWQRSRQRVARWSPSFRRGRAKDSTRTDSRAAPATLRLHLDVSILR